MTNTHDIRLERAPDDRTFGRGERAIVVNGVRWGRTHVTHHGCNGTTHTFEQEEGDIIVARPGAKYPGEISVRSEKRPPFYLQAAHEAWVPTEQRVLEKVRGLIAEGRLVHPDVKRKRNADELARWRAEHQAKDVERKAAFHAKAIEALQINDPNSDDPRIDAVVAAMEWAREQH